MHFPLFESQGQDNGFFSYQIPLSQELQLTVAGGTKKGIEHELDNAVNQDNYLAIGPLLAVADGLGGQYRGDIASRIVLDCLALYGQRNSIPFPDTTRKTALIEYLLAQNIPASHVLSIQDDVDIIAKGIRQNWNIDAVCTSEFSSAKTILEKLSSEKGKKMDTTIVALEFLDGNIHWYHQGDSPLYYWKDRGGSGALARPDHGKGENQGKLTATVTMPVRERNVESTSFEEGDNYLLFSDALLLEGRAATLLPQLPFWYREIPPRYAPFKVPLVALRLIEEAHQGGDDTTIVVARVEKKV